MNSSRMPTIRTVAMSIPECTGWEWGCVSQHALGRAGVCPGGCLPGGGVCLGVVYPQLRLRTVTNNHTDWNAACVVHPTLWSRSGRLIVGDYQIRCNIADVIGFIRCKEPQSTAISVQNVSKVSPKRKLPLK